MTRSQRRKAAKAARAAARAGGQPPATTPFDDNPAVLKRIRQEAARLVQKRLGVTLEEAQRLVAAAKPGAPAAPAPGGQPPATPPGPSPTEAQLRAEVERLTERVNRQHRTIGKIKNRSTLKETALEMKFEAKSSGIAEKYVNFAITEYGELFAQYKANPGSVTPEVKAAFEKDPVDSRVIFGHIRAQVPAIADAGAPPPERVPLSPTTAPPASRNPGETTSPAKPPGAPPAPAFDANKMTEKEWRDHKRRTGLHF